MLRRKTKQQNRTERLLKGHVRGGIIKVPNVARDFNDDAKIIKVLPSGNVRVKSEFSKGTKVAKVYRYKGDWNFRIPSKGSPLNAHIKTLKKIIRRR